MIERTKIYPYSKTSPLEWDENWNGSPADPIPLLPNQHNSLNHLERKIVSPKGNP